MIKAISNVKEAKFLRVFVFFDLPTKTKHNIKQANRFRNYLLSQGFFMLQYSIYTRICKGDDRALLLQKKIKANIPQEGHIRLLTITEKQYERMDTLLGEVKNDEKNGLKQLLLF